MVKTLRKKGRPQGSYRTSWGEQISGLIRLADGRWKICSTKRKFTEPDERLAVVRFKNETDPTVDIPTQHQGDIDAASGTFLKRLHAGQPTYYGISVDPGQAATLSTGNFQPAPELWAWLRQQILGRPEYVATMTGIEQISYLGELSKPVPSHSLTEILDAYTAKTGLSGEECGRIKRFWKQFAGMVGIKTIREITHNHVEGYEKAIGKLGLSPKSVKHRYSGIKTVIAYAMKRGKSPADCRKALDCLAMLEVEGVNTLDPKPIQPDDFWKIYRAAEKAGDSTFAGMMLFALNAALYSSEVGAVKWDDVDLNRGEFAIKRHKTKVPRVAMLWPETIKALKRIERNHRETVFNTCRQAYNRFSIHRDWTKYRTVAKVRDGVTFAMIRDAAFTEACRVSLDQSRVLAGHRLPGAVDHYVLRNPPFVKDACEAIRKLFY